MDEGMKKYKPKAANSQTGFSMIELMTVICIMAILAALATPPLLSWMSGRKLSNASRDVLGAMQLARLQAVKERANVVVNFNLIGNSYVVFVDDGNGGGVASNNIQDGSEVSKKAATLDGVDISAANFGGNTYVAFTSRGFSGSGSVTLQDSSGSSRQVVVNATGNSQIQ